MEINEIKSKITDRTKVIFGVVVLIVGVIFLALLGVKFFLRILLIAIPAILLVIPNDNIKNSRIIGIILIIWLVFNLLTYLIGVINPHSYFEANYNFFSAGFQFSQDVNYFSEIDMLENLAFISCLLMLFYTILNIIGALMFFVPTKNEGSVNNNAISANSQNEFQSNFCPNCGSKLDRENNFCSSCGNKIK